MPRKRKPQIVAERYEHKNTIEYFVYFPGSKQYVIIFARGMSHREVKKFLYDLAKTPRNLIALDGKEENGWKFYVHRYGFDKVFPEDPHFDLYGYGPDEKQVIIGFQRAETSIRALALAVALSKKAELPPLLDVVLESLDEKLSRERKKNEKKYARFIGGANNAVRKKKNV